MGVGKSTIGAEVARRLGRPLVSTDALVEDAAGASIEQLFAERGEDGFRVLEEAHALEALGSRRLSVIDLGGGAVLSERTRAALAESALTVLLDRPVDELWARVAGSRRPLARSREAFLELYERRAAVYEAAADARARDADGVLLAAAGVLVEEGAVERLGASVPGDGPLELVVDENVERLHAARVSAALGERLRGRHVVPPGERAKTLRVVERLWSDLRLDRSGTIVALGGGTTTDLAGFAAATYLRGIDWVSVPTTLVGQVDAAIGGKVGIDLERGKNLVGAFHWPARTVVDPGLLATLPEVERTNGLAEVVKTGLLAGAPLWELDPVEQVRRCAAFKAGICLRDPHDRGERAQLNLGHTFAHALEAASGYELAHGRAVALGLVAALRLSGLDELAEDTARLLDVRPVRVDREAAWESLQRDKKAVGGEVRLVLLARPGEPRIGVRVPPAEVRAALDTLID